MDFNKKNYFLHLLDKITLKFLFYIGLLFPILFYFKERSYIAQDEGYYALQAKWIIDSGNWIAPMWWDSIIYDRTIGIQWLIAFSQKLFGDSIFAAHLPSLIAGIITLFFSYKIAYIIKGKNNAIITIFILATTFLWVDNLHLATQDMSLLAFELFGIFSLLKYQNTSKAIWTFFAGLSIGPAIMLKSFMIILPILAILPYIIVCQRKILSSLSLWLGVLLGIIPFASWLILSIQEYGLSNVSGLVNKVYYLSYSDSYSGSFLYYFWNFPANTFPWIIFCIIGLITNQKISNHSARLLLTSYPLILFLLLSLFKTKTSYYSLQMVPFMAINASIGIQYVFSSEFKYKKCLSILFISFGLIFILASLFILINTFIHAFNFHYIDTKIVILLLNCLGFPFLLFSIKNLSSKRIFLLLLAPYLAYSIIVQNGFLTNRDPQIKLDLVNSLVVNNHTINFILPSQFDEDSFKKLVKVALYTPTHGLALRTVDSINRNQYAWVHYNSLIAEDMSDIDIIYRSESIRPWILIQKR
ncbi:ArnT family glycosyltransferase [Prochlorococcus marinus]|uniref:ArnT family glycosyltransferase n=1 Tax=Prochlorococcus marinus TaxID=1219 RepID=UPI0022B3C30D|nr:glycosyltransferase family 39 protein [Prochlorococcus marinus]